MGEPYYDLDADLFRAFLAEDTSRGERKLLAAVLGFDAEDEIIDLDATPHRIDADWHLASQ